MVRHCLRAPRVPRGRLSESHPSKIEPLPPVRQRDPVARGVAVPALVPALGGPHGQAVWVEHGCARMPWGADRGVVDPRHVTRFAHQGGSNPPVIVIHGNALEDIGESYRRYLEGFFREKFDLAGTPLRIEFRTKENPFVTDDNKR